MSLVIYKKSEISSLEVEEIWGFVIECKLIFKRIIVESNRKVDRGKKVEIFVVFIYLCSIDFG